MRAVSTMSLICYLLANISFKKVATLLPKATRKFVSGLYYPLKWKSQSTFSQPAWMNICKFLAPRHLTGFSGQRLNLIFFSMSFNLSLGE
jgi:hypothetical protein